MNIKHAWTPALVVLASCLDFALAAPLRLQVDTLPPAGLPLELSGELAAAVGADSTQAFLVHGPRQSCLSQTVSGNDGVSHLYWLPQETGVYEVSATGATEQAGSIARVEAGKIFINNGIFTALHDPARAGGLPTALTIAGAKAALPVDYADRLYRKDTGEFFLARQPAPQLKLIANGPLLVIVELTSGFYSSPAKPAPAHPQARYRFTYFRNSPLVRVQMAVTQTAGFDWKELHVLELRMKTSAPDAPKRWAGGEPATNGVVTHSTATHLFSRWAALFSESATVAVLNPHGTSHRDFQVRCYDGPGLLYVMGPWVEFHGPRVEFERYLYFGNGQAVDLAAQAAQLDALQPPRVLLPELEARAQTMRNEILHGGRGAQRMLQLWRINRALTDLRALRHVAAARQVLEQPVVPTGGASTAPVEKISLGAEGEAVVTDQLLLAFDPRGQLTGFYQAATDTELLAQPCSMFRFVAHDPADQEATLTACEAERVTTAFKNGELHLRFSSHVFGATEATVELALRPVGGSVFWRGEARLSGTNAACWRLDFPVLDGVGRREGDDHADAVITPDGWGRWLPRPTAAHYVGRYPGGGATMQCIGYARGDATFGVVARDGRCFIKDLVALGSEDTHTVALEARHYPEEMGRTRACRWPYEVETVALRGDWFALAQHYRAWATQQEWCAGGANRRRPDSPDWFRKLVWWHHDGTRDGVALTNTFAHLRAAVPFPMAFHWYNWHHIPFDNFYPDYFPVNDYVPATRATLREWHVPVMPYINGHLWDTQSQSFTNENAGRWAMKKADGALYIEHWNKHDHSTACPFTAAWQNKMVSVTDRLFREVGVDAVYLDQIGAVHAQLCFDTTHGHPRGGGDHYVAGYWKLLRAVRENARRINPNAALTTEDTAEPYLRYLDGTLMCNRANPDSIPFFPAVYHEHIAQFGLYIHEPEVRAGVTFRSKEAMLFQFGAQLGWNGTDWRDQPAHQEKFRWLAQLAAYRQLGLDWLAYGVMLQPPRVTLAAGAPVPLIAETWIQHKLDVATEQPAVTASAWQSPDGRVALFVVNVSDQPQQIALAMPATAAEKKFNEWKTDGGELELAPPQAGQLRLDLAPCSVRMLATP